MSETRLLQARGLAPTDAANLRGTATAVVAALLLTGCGSVRETLPARSAMEQLLISTAADRAVAQLPVQPFSNKSVYVDPVNLECQDKPYVLQQIRTVLRAGGARIVDSRDKSEVVLEAASGALSINKRDMLFGFPALPLPLQFSGQVVKLPEVPLWKTITYRGRAKLLFSAVDARTGERVADIGCCHGRARDSYWWLLVLGPMRHTDLPKEAR